MSEASIEHNLVQLPLEELKQIIWKMLRKNPLYGSWLENELEEHEKISPEDSSRFFLAKLELIRRIENLTSEELKKLEEEVDEFLISDLTDGVDALAGTQVIFIAQVMKGIGRRGNQLTSQSTTADHEMALAAEVKQAIAKLAPHTQN